ncbi:hypothetical protein FZC83_02305 [Rossellomorea marisflavi]|uniref:Bacillus phage SPbeta YonK domain-containing protein n=1 Tax=Rossellomorea marisflavi TaxID=189381 RepID=A0A5D4S0H1_9BACI|nr:YonK family protein [Rossellomorea marisflavi]TYS56429.1 hypothetical protein FZC83_02305 [Rossellomorea marisflavi]
MPSKKTHSVSVKGQFDQDKMEITEITKEDEFTYDFDKILQEFDGKNIMISIKEDVELPVKDEEGE